jgi:hypothetical protein
MLDTDPTVLARLCDASENHRNRVLDLAKEREDAALGALCHDAPTTGTSPENMGFALFTTLLPSMVTSSPIMEVSSDGTYEERLQAAAIAAAGTQICHKQNLNEALEPAAWDFVFKPYAAMFIEKPRAKMSDLTRKERATMQGRMFEPFDDGGTADDSKSPRATETPRVDNPARWPRLKRLDPRMCGFDYQGGTLAEARFTWHDVKECRKLLRKRAEENSNDWYVDAVEALSVVGDEDYDEVSYRVIYVPGGTIDGTEPKPTQPGTIHTIGRSTEVDQSGTQLGIEVRRPFYWEGHPAGPHIFEGQYTTGSDSFFTTLLLANSDALQMLDAVSFAAHEKIRRHTVKYAYDAAYQAEMEELHNAPDGAFVPLPGLRDGRVLERVETGEIGPAEVNELREVQMNAQRALGLDDAARGLANDKATATAVSVAANTVRTKVQYILSRWERFVRSGMERMAWEIAHDDRVAIRLDERGREDVLRAKLAPLVQQGVLMAQDIEQVITDLKMAPMMYQGGDFANSEDGLDWHSLNIRVDPGSIDGSRGDAAIAKQSVWNQQLMMLGQAAATQPHIDWSTRVRETAIAFGVGNEDRILDRQVLQAMLQMQLAQGSLGSATASGQSADASRQGATLREATGGASSPTGVDPGTYQTS